MSRVTSLLLVLALFVAPVVLAEQVPYEAARSLSSGGSTSWIEFDVEPNSLYEVEATSLSFVPVINVERDGSHVATLRGHEGSILQQHVISGDASTLRLGITSTSNDGGNYLISVAPVDVGGTLESGDFRTGRLEADDAGGERGRVDWYRLSLSDGGALDISLTSDDFDTYLRVMKSDGTESTNDDGGEDRNSRLTISGGTGEYAFVGVTSFGSGARGNYELRVSPIEATGTISPGEVVSGRLEEGDSPRDHLYTLEGEPGTQIILQLESSDFDTVLQVSSQEGGELRNDDAPGSMGTNSQLFLELGESGQALVTVDRFGSGTGRYQLSALRYVGSGDSERREDGYVLSAGEVLDQAITTNDRDSQGRLSHRFRYEADQGEEITISLSSNMFDTYLIVNGPDGSTLEDDDGGGNRNSELTFTAESSGMYEIIATSFDREGVGPYTIEVQSQ